MNEESLKPYHEMAPKAEAIQRVAIRAGFIGDVGQCSDFSVHLIIVEVVSVHAVEGSYENDRLHVSSKYGDVLPTDSLG